MLSIALRPSFVLTAIMAGVESPPTLKVSVSRSPFDVEWDSFLAQTPGAHVEQSSMWAQLKDSLGWRAVRLIVRESGRIVGGAQILVRTFRPHFRIGYIARGPTFTAPSQELATMFCAALQEQVQAEGLHCIIVQPAADSTVMTTLLDCGYRPLRLATLMRATTIIDLSQSLDDILENMRPKTRKSVRQSQRRGVSVRLGDDNDVTTYYQLMMATAGRQEFCDYSQAYFEEMWRIFRPRGHVQLFVAEHGGKAVTATLRTAFGDTVVCKKRGWSGEFGDLRPNEAIDWACIQWAKQAGYRYYDFEGIPLSIAESVLRGETIIDGGVQSPATYKLGYGGEVRLLPMPVVYFSNRLLRWGHRTLYPTVADWAIVDRIANRIKVN